MIQYLKVENAILRGKLPKVVQVTPRERARLGGRFLTPSERSMTIT